MDTLSPEASIQEAAVKDNGKDAENSKRISLPVFTLLEMITFIAKIYTELGIGAYHDKDLIAKIHGVSYVGIKQKFSTAQSYGLLEMRHGVGYKITPLFLKIHKPISDEEKTEGILQALHFFDLYGTLIDELNGHPAPSEQGLAARLIRSFQIKDYAANKAAGVFLENLKGLGFLDANNVLRAQAKKTADNNGGDTTGTNDKQGSSASLPILSKDQQSLLEIPIPLKGGRRAYIRIPEDYTSEDCQRIAKFVDALN